jgi:hypothetical protein
MSEPTSIREPKILNARVPGGDAISKYQAASQSNLEGVILVANNLIDTVYVFKTPLLAAEFLKTCSPAMRGERSKLTGLMTLEPIEIPKEKEILALVDGVSIGGTKMIDGKTRELATVCVSCFVRMVDASGILKEERLYVSDTVCAVDVFVRYAEPEIPSRAVAEATNFLCLFNAKARAEWDEHLANQPPPPDPAKQQAEILGAAIAAGIDRALARMNLKPSTK